MPQSCWFFLAHFLHCWCHFILDDCRVFYAEKSLLSPHPYKYLIFSLTLTFTQNSLFSQGSFDGDTHITTFWYISLPKRRLLYHFTHFSCRIMSSHSYFSRSSICRKMIRFLFDIHFWCILSSGRLAYTPTRQNFSHWVRYLARRPF